MKCIIVDDEPLAVNVLKNYVAKIEALDLQQTFSNATEAFIFLQQHGTDLMFLDIQMPGLTGLELLRNLSHPPAVILTTAFRDHALEGFELNVLDYLVKPIGFERFLKAVGKANLNIKENSEVNSTQQNTLEKSFVYIKVDKTMVKVLLEDILFVESLKNYVKIVTKDKQLVTYATISYMEDKLPQKYFVRFHRSFITAVDKIESYTQTTLTVGKTVLPIGGMYKEEVLNRLNSKLI